MNFPPHNTCDDSNDKFDDDLLSAALLFFDQTNGETDTDSHSTPEPQPPQEEEVLWYALGDEFSSYDAQLESFERPAKMPRQIQVPSIVRPEADSIQIKMEEIFTGNLPEASSLWETLEQNFRPAAPRRVNRRKEEINVLRVQAEALEARLEALRSPSPFSQRGVELSSSGGLGWHDIATQQSKQRKRSESENRRLRELTTEHRRIAKAMRRIATRQTNSKMGDSDRPQASQPRSAFASILKLDGLGNPSKMISSLDEMLLQTDHVLPQSPGRVFTTKRHGDSYMTVTLRDTRNVPFSVAKTASAVWNYSLLNHDLSRQQWSPVGNGSFLTEFVAFVTLGDFQDEVEGKLVLRRVEEPTRTIIMRYSLFHCVTAAQSIRFLTVPLRHFLWTVIDQPQNLGDLSGRDVISRIRTCAVSMPRLDVGDPLDPTREAEVAALVEMCTQIATQQAEQTYDIVDNMLLDSEMPSRN